MDTNPIRAAFRAVRRVLGSGTLLWGLTLSAGCKTVIDPPRRLLPGDEGTADAASPGGADAVADAGVESTDASPGTHERPDGGDGAPPPPRDPERIAQHVVEQAETLVLANQILTVFFVPRVFLSGAFSSCMNAEQVAAHVRLRTRRSELAECAAVETTCDQGISRVSATFAGCPLGHTGGTISGTATAELSFRSIIGDLPLTELTVFMEPLSVVLGEEERTIAGTMTTAPAGQTAYDLSAQLDANGESISFTGEIEALMSNGRDLARMVAHGEGVVSPPGERVSFGDLHCPPVPLHYAMTGMVRELDQCTFSAGMLRLDETYECMERPGGASVVVSDTLSWQPDTPRTHDVHLVSTSWIDDEAVGNDERFIEVPGLCGRP